MGTAEPAKAYSRYKSYNQEMNMEYGFWNPNRRKSFSMMYGNVVDIQAYGYGSGKGGMGCSQFVTLELEDQNITNFIVTSETYVVHFEKLCVGMNVMFFYEEEAPVPLVYPPQFQAVAVAEAIRGQMVKVSYFDQNLVSSDKCMQLNMDSSVPVRTVNNQDFICNPGNRYLLVVYDRVTRSMPMQTTPLQVVVLCNV